jgi:hypothetical protein
MKPITIGALVVALGLLGLVWLRSGDDLAARARLDVLEGELQSNPDNAGLIRSLSLEYATELYEDGPSREHVEAALRESRNVWVLSNTAYSLQSLYNRGLQMGTPNPRARELAEQYFERAKVMDPNLDRAAILPEIDVEQIRGEQEQEQRSAAIEFAQAARNIRRLPVDAFPQLPDRVARVLRGRRCEIPQAPDHAPHNVIRGEFFERGQAGWAVLCSVEGSSTLLVFRSDRDESPVALATSEDSSYLQGGVGTIDFSHGIEGVDRGYIVRHAQPGAPRPKFEIDHAGIDDAFLGKGSRIWYFERGSWLQLPGAD